MVRNGWAKEAQAGRDSDRLFRLLAENASDMIVLLALDGTRTYVSPACRTILGYEPEEIMGVSTFVYVHPDDLEPVRERMRAVAEGHGDRRGVNRIIRSDGRTAWVESSLRLVRDPVTGEPREIVAVVRDITQQKLNEARVEQLASTDELTGLPNRRAFLAGVEAMLAKGARCALLFIDLDNFKPINDIHGHSAGDAVLTVVASRLRQEAPAGAMVARLGGDEFAILLADGHLAAELAEHILQVMAAPVVTEDLVAEIGASIGISRCPEQGHDSQNLLRTADMAMDHAKRAGPGRYFFFASEMEEELREKTVFKVRLRQAITAGEIIPYYQPLVDLRSRRLIGLEVLARWKHPDRGVLPPSEFITHAELGGLISPLFNDLLRQACHDATQWPDGLKIAVNMSPLQLQDAALSGTVLNILSETGLSPLRLELEVTETGIVHDLGTAKRLLGMLREAGIRVALDDFGTGYASLRMVKELAVDRLKIDRSFVVALASAPESGRYVSAIIGLARALGLGTTAEGIEDASTMRRIASMGCDLGQGYFFGRPHPASELGPWLRDAAEGLPAVPEAEIVNPSSAQIPASAGAAAGRASPPGRVLF
ncbi:putative bifunctional diguanylate cyclase/phosphodiesterase [Roseomonas marmotae]|uniref:EAL domain-containing protein n=1 Tax=Roseomonas marmotae TaxID=2768161 RepID=A0ABS3KBI4_9PROT|nr:EAL domain-containing protein [Roseomonas marmotae]MBO1074830.1 EAL domain-containing protein [Roseomonas marmotae]QTI80664.1 EAL domain-containing protein [Roseomonas marmotae]